jgi:hypothetical protein
LKTFVINKHSVIRLLALSLILAFQPLCEAAPRGDQTSFSNHSSSITYAACPDDSSDDWDYMCSVPLLPSFTFFPDFDFISLADQRPTESLTLNISLTISIGCLRI